MPFIIRGREERGKEKRSTGRCSILAMVDATLSWRDNRGAAGVAQAIVLRLEILPSCLLCASAIRSIRKAFLALGAGRF
jgi:hypothetical protein